MREQDAAWSPAQVSAWLERLGLQYPAVLDATFLDLVQRQHLRRIPFETLDVAPLGRYQPLSYQDSYDKIVESGRGGYCFELNGLLGTMLEALGYLVIVHPGHWVTDPATPFDRFEHFVLEVTVPDEGSRWYVDVAAGRENPQGIVELGGIAADEQHRSRQVGSEWHLERADGAGGWQPRLVWYSQICTLDDFQTRHRYFHTDPDSIFRRLVLCTMQTENGRITLANHTQIVTEHGIRTETELGDDAAWRQALATHFGIQIETTQ